MCRRVESTDDRSHAMSSRFVRPGQAHTQRWSKATVVLGCVLVAFLLLLLTACGSNGSDDGAVTGGGPDSRPEVAQIQSQVEQFKAEYIQKFLVFGTMKEALSDNDKAELNTKVMQGLESLGSESWFTSYMDIYDSYSDGDLDFANLLASFNILTQYADFDLLRQQAPEEAVRLGIP
jgi:hypothetical protein